MSEPRYIESFKSGLLKKNKDTALSLLSNCSLCPHQCNVNRTKGERGVCKTGRLAKIASYSPHFGEESPLVGSYGSGTIFIGGCNLLCLFCQNSDISHQNEGYECDSQQFSDIMLDLQKQGCHNINFVTPTHVIPQILEALFEAIPKGLHIPLIYNSSGYDSVDALVLLDGVIDIYMPDIKFFTSQASKTYTAASNYPQISQKAVLEMYRQVGDLHLENGLAVSGILIRHLVMPSHLSETTAILKFIAKNLSLRTYLNIMDQYRPCFEAFKLDPINTSLSQSEFNEALRIARELGFAQLDQKDWSTVFKSLLK